MSRERLVAERRSTLRAAIGGGVVAGVLLGPAWGLADSAVGDRLAALWQAMDTPPTLVLSTAEDPLVEGSNITISSNAIYVDHERMVPLQPSGGQAAIPEAMMRGQLIMPLYDHLTEQRYTSQLLSALATGEEAPASVLLSVDEATPFSVLRPVMYTAWQARYGSFQVVVHNPWMGQLAATQLSLPVIGPPRPVEDERPPLALSLLVSADKLSILGAGDLSRDLPCQGGCADVDDYDWEALSELLGHIKDEHPDDVTIIVVPDGQIRHDVVIRAVDVARWAPMSPASDAALQAWQAERRTLFPAPIVAGGAM